MNSTKKSNQSQDTLPAAVPGAVETLANFDKLATVLCETGEAISKGLAEEVRLYSELGAVEVSGGDAGQLHGQLDEARGRRQVDVRRRTAATEGLAKMEAELLEVRRTAVEARSGLAAGAVAELQRQWGETVDKLARLYAEAEEFQRAMRIAVPLPAPYRATQSAITGQPALQFTAAATAQPTTLPGPLQALTDLINKLDAAVGLAGGIRGIHEADQRHYRLASERRMSADMPGTYVVVKPVGHLGANFERGALVDSTLINVGTLYRLQMGHYVMAATRPAAA